MKQIIRFVTPWATGLATAWGVWGVSQGAGESYGQSIGLALLIGLAVYETWAMSFKINP